MYLSIQQQQQNRSAVAHLDRNLLLHAYILILSHPGKEINYIHKLN